MKYVLQIFFNLWKLKNGYNKFSNKFIKKIFENAYYLHLKRYGSYIDLKANFINIPLFPHDYFGIFISGGSHIGRDCVIFQHVTIGSNTIPKSKKFGSPTIGDNCYIGAGAKIIGNISIGNNCRIGANCVVVNDIKSNSVVVNGKVNIIQKEELDNRFYTKKGDNWVYYSNGNWVLDKKI